MQESEVEKMLKDNIEIYNHYETKNQMFVWIEEMSELTKVICKWARKYDELEGDLTPELKEAFIDEITDVTISLDQIKYAIQLFEDVLLKRYKYKVDRQMERIKNEV